MIKTNDSKKIQNRDIFSNDFFLILIYIVNVMTLSDLQQVRSSPSLKSY